MSVKIIAAQPPFFSETHAATIADAAREYPDADGLFIHIPAQRAIAAASLVDGPIHACSLRPAGRVVSRCPAGNLASAYEPRDSC